MINTSTSSHSGATRAQALALHEIIAHLMREFRVEPGLLAGSVYDGLHANDIGLFEILAESADWNVRKIAETLSAPMTTVSSALDRLEKQGLVERKRISSDRRVVRIELTVRGRRLAARLEEAHVGNCRAMLDRLGSPERDEFLLLAAKLAGK